MWTIPTSESGKHLWVKNSEFVAWITHEGPSLTTVELQEQIERRTGIRPNYSTIRHLRRSLGISCSPENIKRAYQQRTNCTPPVPSELRLIGPEDREHFVTVTGNTLITSDWHIPHHSRALFERLLIVAKRLGVKQLIINGDFLNEDAFSKWRYHPFNVGWMAEKAAAREVILRLCETFDRIYYILDNHDRRILAMHERPSEFTEEDLLKILETETSRGKIRASIYYHYVILNGIWRITSPKEYRRIKLSLPTRLAQLYHMNIISGGDHLFAMGVDDSAQYVIANNACMVNPKEVPYINVQDSTFPHWLPGFYAVIDDVLYPFILHDRLWPRWIELCEHTGDNISSS